MNADGSLLLLESYEISFRLLILRQFNKLYFINLLKFNEKNDPRHFVKMQERSFRYI
jgi:hypothetical protein